MEATNIRVGELKETERRYLQQQGALASICCSYVDGDGKSVGEDLFQRPIGQSLESLKKSKIIAVALGDSKVEAIGASLRSGRVHVLVTDLATAKQLAIL